VQERVKARRGCYVRPMTPELRRLFDRHALGALEHQLHLVEVVATGDWSFDLQRCAVTFETGREEREVPVQILGTEAHNDGTWLWSWANTASGLPQPALAAALELRAYGQAHGIYELTEPSFALAQADGHTLAMIAAGMRRAPAYYRCPYDGGAMFVLLEDPDIYCAPDIPAVRLATALPQLIGQIELEDQRAGVEDWAERLGLVAEPREGGLAVRSPGGDEMELDFDRLGRVTQIRTRFAPR
jgi:hypothetical protein